MPAKPLVVSGSVCMGVMITRGPFYREQRSLFPTAENEPARYLEIAMGNVGI